MALMNESLYVYVDYTLDGRPFYVGQGNHNRVQKLKRNKRHASIVKAHGQRRQVVLVTDNRQAALDLEVTLISELKTRHDIPANWGANMTDGGEGIVGISDETRRKMSEARKRRPPPSETTRERYRTALRNRKGEKRSLETRKRLSEAAKRRRLSPENKQKLSDRLKGRQHTEETKTKIGEGVKRFHIARKEGMDESAVHHGSQPEEAIR